MKTPYLSILILAISTSILSSCKNEKQNGDSSEKMVVTDTLQKNGQPEFLYVTAPSGLTLRAENTTSSEKLVVMVYGTKVRVVNPETENTMNVNGIEGGMDELEFNSQKGFAFNGFLSKFFPPKENASAKSYVEELKKDFPKTSYKETVAESVSNPSKTETVLLPTNKWHEAFYIAQQLFDVPKGFAIPNPKGSNSETVEDNNRKKGLFASTLSISRNNNALQKIEYSYGGEGFGGSVSITKEGDAMKIERVEVAD